MADTSSFMDWHPQTPPPAHNPYEGRYIPGGWPVDPPTPAPPTAGVFMPPRRPSPLDHIIPVAKRICADLGGLAGLGYHAATQLGRYTVDATTTVVIVPTVFIVRRFQQRCREQRPRQQRRQAAQRPLPPPLSQSPWNRAVANERRTARRTQSALPQTPAVRAKPQPEPAQPAKQEHQCTEEVLYEVPEFRPQYVLNRHRKIATPRLQYRRPRLDRVFPGMPRFTPPREPKPAHLPTPEEKFERSPLECGKLESPYPQLKPIPASPPSPAETITSVESITPSAQLQQGLYAVTESDTESHSVISSVHRSRKRRIHTQGSRATEDGETTTSPKRVQTEGPSVASPQTPTPTIIVQDAPSSATPKAPSPADTTLLSPPRLKLRRFNTPRSVRPKETAPKSPKTPLSDISSMCDCSPGNYHIDAPRSPVKSEISSFFDGTPPPNPELDAHVFRMIMSGGGSPIPASHALAESESVGMTSAPNAVAAPEQTASETSNNNEPVTPENNSVTIDDLASTAEVTTTMTEIVLGLANQELLSELYTVTNGVEQDIPMQETETFKKESPKTPRRVNLPSPEVTSPIDLIDDKDTSESSSSATSFLHTPEKQLAELRLDDVYTPEQPTPKATPHSSEKIQRVTRAESKRLAILEEKTHYEIVPLTEEWEKKIQTALRHGHGAFKARDFTRVVPLNAHSNRGTDQWLNDEVINGYLNLVVAHGKQNDRPTQVPTHHAFVSFFFNNLESRGYDSVKRWASRAKIGGKNLLETEAVFIPVNSGAHWTLCVVSGKNRTIAHYNSLRGNGKRYINIVKSWVSAELGSAYKESEWTLIEAGESPQQTNMDDCGVFTITSARQIMLGLTPMSYSPDMIPLQRRRIVAELVNGALLKSSL